MDRDTLARTILENIRQQGYPEKPVPLVFVQLYRSAVDNGFSLDSVLEMLKKVHRIDAQRVDDKLVFAPYVKPKAAVSAKTVDKAIGEIVKPVLKKAGFEKNKGRTWWRLGDEAVCVVTFHGFDSYRAQMLGCTTFSLGVRIGIDFKCVDRCPWVQRTLSEPPKESDCQLSLTPFKSQRYVDECPATNIWYVRADGTNVATAVGDVGRVLVERGLPWLEANLNLDTVLQRFLNDSTSAADEDYFGAPYSPARADVVCGIYLSQGDVQSAREYLTRAATQDSSPGSARAMQERTEALNAAYPMS